MAKGTAWVKIKSEYLQGVTPKELGEKYNISSKTIREKASKENWVDEKAIISNNLQQATQKRIQGLTNKALQALEDVIDDTKAEYKDKVQAAKAILDVSGLKSSKQEITGKDGTALIQKVYITEQEKESTNKHIDRVINEQ